MARGPRLDVLSVSAPTPEAAPPPEAPTRPSSVSLPDGVVHVSESPTASPVPRLLWGWPENVKAAGIPRRTLERELSAGRFPKPIKRVGRRPYWRPGDVIAWAGRGGE